MSPQHLTVTTVTISAVTTEELREKILSLAALVRGAEATAEVVDLLDSAQQPTSKETTTPIEPKAAAVEPPKKRGPKPKSPSITKEESAPTPKGSPVSLVPTETDVDEITADEEPSYSIAALRELLQEVNVSLGTKKAIELLKSVGVNRLSELKEEKFSEFAAKAKEILASKKAV